MSIPNNPQRDIKIKELRLRDLPSFVRLRHDIEGSASHVVIGRGERKETIFHLLARRLLSGRRLHVLLALLDGRPVGYVSLVFPRFKKLRGNMYLVIMISASHRGQGIGTLLMREAEVFAKARDIRRIELEVFGKNTAAHHLYQKLGYVEEGRKKNTVKDEEGFDDIILMTKFINGQ